jgi:hypothetical protein
MRYCQNHGGWLPCQVVGIQICRMFHPRRGTLIIHPAILSDIGNHLRIYPIYNETARMYDEWQQNASTPQYMKRSYA